jgi:hypothetical protein
MWLGNTEETVANILDCFDNRMIGDQLELNVLVGLRWSVADDNVQYATVSSPAGWQNALAVRAFFIFRLAV